jgi:hypothetical protein
VLPTSRFSETGVIPEEPAATRVVAAGSVVWCGSVLPDADACGVAFRVAASRTPLPRDAVRTLAAAHHILEVVLAAHHVMLGGYLCTSAELGRHGCEGTMMLVLW